MISSGSVPYVRFVTISHHVVVDGRACMENKKGMRNIKTGSEKFCTSG